MKPVSGRSEFSDRLQGYILMPPETTIDEDLLERMVRAVEKVRERLLRAAKALEDARIPYAVVGGNAVAAWVARVDESAVRNTQDVDIVLRRADLEAAKQAMAGAGFIYRHVKGVDMFLDGPDARARDAVHVVFAGEKVRPEYVMPVPEVSDADSDEGIRLMTLESAGPDEADVVPPQGPGPPARPHRRRPGR